MNSPGKVHCCISILMLMVSLFASSGTASACVMNAAAVPAQGYCQCTGHYVSSTGCEGDNPGQDCDYELLGVYCGTSGHGDCYVGYAYDTFCSNIKPKRASIADENPMTELLAKMGSDPRGCADPEAFRAWLRTAPGFPTNKSQHSGGMEVMGEI
jgi:hypothetical protein